MEISTDTLNLRFSKNKFLGVYTWQTSPSSPVSPDKTALSSQNFCWKRATRCTALSAVRHHSTPAASSICTLRMPSRTCTRTAKFICITVTLPIQKASSALSARYSRLKSTTSARRAMCRSLLKFLNIRPTVMLQACFAFWRQCTSSAWKRPAASIKRLRLNCSG